MAYVRAGQCDSRCDWNTNHSRFLWQSLTRALPGSNLIRDETAQVAIDFLFVRAVANAADEKVGAITDEQTILVIPLHEF